MSEDSTIAPRRQILCAALVAVAGFSTAKAIQAGEDLAANIRTKPAEPDANLFDLLERYGPALSRHNEADDAKGDSSALRSAYEVASKALGEIEDAIEAAGPRTVPGLIAKAKWLSERDPDHWTSFTTSFIRQVVEFQAA